MEKTKPIRPRDEENGSRRDDSNRNSNNGNSRFAKDKRKRIVRVEKNPQPGNTEREQPSRRSYNPNFDTENRLRENQRNEYTQERKGRYHSDNQNNPDKPYKGRSTQGNQGRSGTYQSNNFRRTGDESPERRFGDRTGNRSQSSFRGPGSSPDPRHSQNRFGSRDQKPYGNRNNSRPKFESRGRQQNKGEHTPGAYSDGTYPKFPRENIENDMRLNRYLAMSGICSRREADELICSGSVTVNGAVVTELGTKICNEDVVKYKDKVIQGESKVYIVMNKPKQYVTTLEDPHAEKTVMDLIKNKISERVYPVGRLDKNSMGVLLITNDGEMTRKLTHPSFNKKKIYQVSLDKPLTKSHMQQIADGIELEDGVIHADAISYVGENKKEIGIEIHSGRNRIIRRIFDHFGYTVQKLDRVYFAGLTKKNLRRGAWRFLTPREVETLYSGKYE